MTSGNTTGERSRFLKCFRWNQVVMHGGGCKFPVSASVCQKWLCQQSKAFKEIMLLSKILLAEDGQCSAIALPCSLLAQPSQAGIGLWGFSTQHWQHFQHRLPGLTIPKIFVILAVSSKSKKTKPEILKIWNFQCCFYLSTLYFNISFNSFLLHFFFLN